MFRLEKKKIIALLIVILLMTNISLPIIVYADDNTTGDTATEEITTNYEIKEKGEWDVSEKRDGSIKAIWDYSERKLTITGKGNMINFGQDDVYWEKYKRLIEKIDIGEQITSIGSNSFKKCINLKEIIIPGSVEIIPTNFLDGCSKIETINIPYGVKRIDSYAFSNCSSLKSISLSSTVNDLAGFSFYNCTSLESINIDSNNNQFLSIEGVVYSKDKKSIIYYPANKAGKTFKINSNVTVISENAFYFAQNLETIEFPSGLTTIQYGAFENSKLENIEIPNSVTSIGTMTFSYCTNLNSVILPNKLKTIERGMFNGCYNLKSITIPSSVTSIGEDAFDGCSSIKELSIPNSVVDIDENIIKNFKGIIKCKTNSKAHQFAEKKGIYYILTDNTTSNYSTNYKIEGTKNVKAFNNDNNTIISILNFLDRSLTISGTGDISNVNGINNDYEEKYFVEKVIIESGITSIGENAFTNYTNLESIVMPDTVTSIGERAFYKCTKLTNIELSNNINNIGDYAFYECRSLLNVEIPNSVTTLGSSIFEACKSLKQIEIPNSINEIGGFSVALCESLENIDLGNNDKYVTQDGVLYDKRMTTLLRYSPKKSGDTFVIPDSVTTINSYAFNCATNLKSIVIPSNIKTIGTNAFNGCKNLTDVQLNANINELSNFIFSGCTNLKNINIPETVKTIGEYAFSSCYSLEKIELPNSLEKISGNCVFKACNKLEEIKILNESLNITKQAFSEYNGIIKFKKNSTVHKYCEENKIPYILLDKDINETDNIEYEQAEKIEIYTGNDMWNLANRLNNEEWTSVQQRGLIVELRNDIDLGCNEQKQWIPIKKFNGTFEGNYHSISNMYIKDSDTENYISQGFIQKVESTGIIKNVKFKDSTINIATEKDGYGFSYYGIIAANLCGNMNNCQTENCIINISKIQDKGRSCRRISSSCIRQ